PRRARRGRVSGCRSRGSSSSSTGDVCGWRASLAPEARSDSLCRSISEDDASMADELVLIVDDNQRNVKLARDVLRFAGFLTLEAGTAGEGLALAAEHLPDVILMDIRLPDMEGTE